MTEVVLDDYIPCNKQDQPFSLAAVGKEIWVILLEKAWAKLHGNYLLIDG